MDGRVVQTAVKSVTLTDYSVKIKVVGIRKIFSGADPIRLVEKGLIYLVKRVSYNKCIFITGLCQSAATLRELSVSFQTAVKACRVNTNCFCAEKDSSGSSLLHCKKEKKKQYYEAYN